MYTAVKQVKARGKTRVCKFFLRGRCKFGNRCKNLHFRKKGTPRCRKTKSLSNFRLLSLLTPDLRALILRFLDATGYAAISCVNKHIHHRFVQTYSVAQAFHASVCVLNFRITYRNLGLHVPIYPARHSLHLTGG